MSPTKDDQITEANAGEMEAGEALSKATVKLLRAGDVIQYSDCSLLCTVVRVDPRTGLVTYCGDGFEGGHDCLGWTFISRPAPSAVATPSAAACECEALREAMPDLTAVIAWLKNGCDPVHAITELAIYKGRIDQALHAGEAK